MRGAALRPYSHCSLHLPHSARPVPRPHSYYRPLWRDTRLANWALGVSSADPPETVDQAAATFSTLLRECAGTDAADAVHLHLGTNGRGIFAAKETSASAKVIFSVPMDRCIVVDYTNEGLRLPVGEWPRVSRGLAKDNALPWDIVHALALLDGLAGNGDAFWCQYTNEILPQPELLTLPVCLPEELLSQLEHPAIIEAALQQKQRLASLFPGLSSPACVNGPTWLEWAFSCVRSRAFALGKDAFAFVPFLDAANHALEPNANFEVSPDRRSVNLVSLKSIEEGEELTISYTGELGYTNQRFMAQYGFVPAQGNVFGRLEFKCLDEGRNNNVLLSLDALQIALGDDDAMVNAFSGRDSFMYAALKSLPVAAMESDAAPVSDQLKLAEEMLREVEAEQKEWKTSAEEDATTLPVVGLELNTGKATEGVVDPRLAAVVRYRLHRKRMVEAAGRVLKTFLHR